MEINIIAAVAPNGAIGFHGKLPWNIPEDLVHFKHLTWGHSIIMGRKTCESLPHGALPGRRNIVVSQTIKEKEGFEIFNSLEQAFAACSNEKDVFIIGGESLYRQALPLAEKLFLTIVDESPLLADTFFPKIDMTKWIEKKKEKHNGFSFKEFTRIDY